MTNFIRKYKVQKHCHRWMTVATTDSVESAFNFIRRYDSDGEIYMRIIDDCGVELEFNAPITSDSHANKINWRKEGF